MRLLIYPLLYRSYGYTYSPCLPFYRVHAVTCPLASCDRMKQLCQSLRLLSRVDIILY